MTVGGGVKRIFANPDGGGGQTRGVRTLFHSAKMWAPDFFSFCKFIIPEAKAFYSRFAASFKLEAGF